jgi:hypothetical protein
MRAEAAASMAYTLVACPKGSEGTLIDTLASKKVVTKEAADSSARTHEGFRLKGK